MDIDALLKTASDDAARLELLNAHGEALARAGSLDDAFGIATRAGALARDLGSDRGLARSWRTQANCDYLRADYVSAHKRSLESCTVSEHARDREGVAAALLLAAACQFQMGALEESHTALLQVLEMLDDAPDDEFAFRAHNMLGMVLSGETDYGAAESHFALAGAAGTRMRSDFYLQRVGVNRASLCRRVGAALLAEGRQAEALARFQEGAAACEAMRADAGAGAYPENAAGCAGVLGEICVQLGRTEEALALFGEMLRHGAAMKNPLIQAEALLHMGRHYTRCENDPLARDCLERSLEMATRAKARGLVVEVHEAQAQWCEMRGDPHEALQRYKRFHQLSGELQRAELNAAAKLRTHWLDFQRERRDATAYQERFESLVRDNEELTKRASGLTRETLEDPLTGLSNRRYLDLRLGELIEAHHSKAVRVSVAMLDVDRFKAINDQFSHAVGDEVLRSAATMIRTHCREGDVAARFGGDEFVLCLIGASLEAAEATLERLRSRLETHDWSAIHPGLAVGVSIGATQVRPGDDSAALMARADAALYRAKLAGRNRICVD